MIRFRNYEPTSEDLASLPKVEAPVIPEVEELVGTVRWRCRKVGLVPSPVGLLARLPQALTAPHLSQPSPVFPCWYLPEADQAVRAPIAAGGGRAQRRDAGAAAESCAEESVRPHRPKTWRHCGSPLGPYPPCAQAPSVTLD